ncbi:MAG: glutathione peroxidase [Tenericutes bacterium]|nr:glutathione peroxidase [Mycoplasmatota bacterium]
MSIYDINIKKMSGETIQLKEYIGKTLLIVNTASKCGFTKQFAGLQALYEKYSDKGFVILGFPCNQFLKQDPASDEDILEFCQLNFGVNFPMFSKINVRGKNQAELFKFLIGNSPVSAGKSIKWNFEKFLINKDGKIVNRFASKITPEKLSDYITVLL